VTICHQNGDYQEISQPYDRFVPTHHELTKKKKKKKKKKRKKEKKRCYQKWMFFLKK